MRLLQRGEIDQVKDLETIDVPTPEWGADTGVRLRALDGLGRDRWTASMSTEDRAANLTNVRARLVALCAIDGAGALLYPTEADAVALGKKAGHVLDRLFDSAQKLSKLTKATVDEAEKNSVAAPSGASSSASA